MKLDIPNPYQEQAAEVQPSYGVRARDDDDTVSQASAYSLYNNTTDEEGGTYIQSPEPQRNNHDDDYDTLNNITTTNASYDVTADSTSSYYNNDDDDEDDADAVAVADADEDEAEAGGACQIDYEALDEQGNGKNAATKPRTKGHKRVISEPLSIDTSSTKTRKSSSPVRRPRGNTIDMGMARSLGVIPRKPPPMLSTSPMKAQQNGIQVIHTKLDTSGGIPKDWNEEFQQQLDLSFKKTTIPQEELDRVVKLRHISREFAQAAKRTGVTIIHELYKKDKTIPPVTGIVGGIAGGEKYVHQGIFFKVAIENKVLYGEDEHAMKAGGHELKGMMSFLDCRIPYLHFPLVALIDYMGYRLVAQSVLPISDTTLCYGSKDGAHTIYDVDPKLTAMMKQMAKHINLRAHPVVSQDKTVKVMMYGPADIEGHLGADGRYYVIDTARLLPPTGPKNAYLYKLFRPEFLKKNPVPLSPDAYSKFGKENAQEFEKDVEEAAQRLLGEVIPEFAADLNSRYSDDDDAGNVAENSSSSTSSSSSADEEDSSSAPDEEDEWNSNTLPLLIAEMHLYGINCRYLMHVYHHVTCAVPRCMILTETLARVLKQLLCKRWRALGSSEESQYVKEALNFFALVFGVAKESTNYWEWILPPQLEMRYQKCAGPLKPKVNLPVLFGRLQELSGVRFDDPEKFYTLLTSAPGPPDPQLLVQILAQMEIVPRIKHTHQLSFQEGTALAKAANALAARDKTESYAMFKQASRMFRECLAIKPDDVYSLYNWGLSLSQQAKVAEDEKESTALLVLAAEMYAQALMIQPKDHRALTKWGTGLLDQAQAALKLSQSTTDESQAAREIERAFNLLVQSVDKLSQSAQLQPKEFDTRYNCGTACMWLAKVLQLKKKTPTTENSTNVNLFSGPSVSSDNDRGYRKSRRSRRLTNGATATPSASLISGENAEDGSSFYPRHNDAVRYLQFACEEFKATTELRPNNGAGWLNYGVALAMKARLAEDEREKLFDEAFAAYGNARDLEPENPEISFNWGNALYRRAKLEKDNDGGGTVIAIRHLMEACKRYEETQQEHPAFKDAFLNWGIAIELLITNIPFLTKIKEKDKSLLDQKTKRLSPGSSSSSSSSSTATPTTLGGSSSLNSISSSLTHSGSSGNMNGVSSGGSGGGSPGSPRSPRSPRSPTIGPNTASNSDACILRFLDAFEKESKLVCNSSETDLLAGGFGKVVDSIARITSGSEGSFSWLRLEPLAAISQCGNKSFEAKAKELLHKFSKSTSSEIAKKAKDLIDATSSSTKLKDRFISNLTKTIFVRKSSTLKDLMLNRGLQKKLKHSKGSASELPKLSHIAKKHPKNDVGKTVVLPRTASAPRVLSSGLAESDADAVAVQTHHAHVFGAHPLHVSKSFSGGMPHLPLKVLKNHPDVHMQGQDSLLYSFDEHPFDMENIVSVTDLKSSSKFKLVKYVANFPQQRSAEYLMRQYSRNTHYAAVDYAFMKRLEHPYIARVRYIYQSADKISVFLGRELLDSTLTHVKSSDRPNRLMTVARCMQESQQPVSDPVARIAAAQTCLAIGRFHDLGLSYWNLSSVHVSGDGDVVLTKQHGVYLIDEGKQKLDKSPHRYLAPEYLRDDPPDDTVAKDWYAFGIFLLELLTGIRVFSGKSRQQILEHFKEHKTVTVPPNVCEDAKNLILALTWYDPVKRLGTGARDYQEICNHSYLRDLYWEDIQRKRHFKHFAPFKETLALCADKEKSKDPFKTTCIAPQQQDLYENFILHSKLQSLRKSD